jgi:hypothetical protein
MSDTQPGAEKRGLEKGNRKDYIDILYMKNYKYYIFYDHRLPSFPVRWRWYGYSRSHFGG